MSLTRANIEAVLVRRCGKLLTAAALDGTTVNGTNADLNDPIGSALRALGYTVASIVAVADSDLSTVGAGHIDQLLDLAELRTLESIQGNNDQVDVRSDDTEKRWAALGTRLEAAIARKRDQIVARYGEVRQAIAPFAGGISVGGKETVEADTDRVVPAFTRALHTNDHLPSPQEQDL